MFYLKTKANRVVEMTKLHSQFLPVGVSDLQFGGP